MRKTLVADARAAVDACAGWNARLAARRITAFLNRRMQDSGLSLAQFGLMAQIAAARDDTLGELARAHRARPVDPVAQSAARSKPRRLSKSRPAAADARRRAVRLTEKGRAGLEAGLTNWKRAHGELAKRLDPEAARRLALATEALEEG